MTRGTPPQDPVAVHRGLLAIARDQKADFNAILVQYAIERLIDRLSRSAEAQRFVLKGAILFRMWTGDLRRSIKEVDFLGHGEASPAAVAEALRRIVSVTGDDGLRFDPGSIAAEDHWVESFRHELEPRLVAQRALGLVSLPLCAWRRHFRRMAV